MSAEFAYLADGKNGMRVVQLTSPETPGNDGFSPRPTPQLIATFKIPKGGEALAIAEGIDRDRAVDESGNQLAVFGRVGARPMNLEEQRKLYLRPGTTVPWQVSDDPRRPDVSPRPSAPVAEGAVRELSPTTRRSLTARPSGDRAGNSVESGLCDPRSIPPELSGILRRTRAPPQLNLVALLG